MSIITLRKRFIRDQQLPIQVLQSPYFDYFLDLYETLYQSRTKYTLFLKEVAQMGGEEGYLNAYDEVKNKILSHVQSKVSFQRFNQDEMSAMNVQTNLPKAKLYYEENDQATFISIDLEKANFHSLRYYDEDILDGKKIYRAWLQQFTSLESLADSKYLRQVIFGNLNPKKQQKIQRFITHSFLNELATWVDVQDVMSASHDEIILRKKQNVTIEELKERLESLYDGAFPLHVDVFTLTKLSSYPEFGFVKTYETSEKIEFKGIASHFMAQAYRFFKQEPLQKEDLLFFHEGQVAQFIAPIVPQNQ